jgi:hypothetical protein
MEYLDCDHAQWDAAQPGAARHNGLAPFAHALQECPAVEEPALPFAVNLDAWAGME